MNDDLERMLRQFRPVGPPAELRERVVSDAGLTPRAPARGAGARGVGRAIIDWTPAAAVFAFALLLHWLASNQHVRLLTYLPQP